MSFLKLGKPSAALVLLSKEFHKAAAWYEIDFFNTSDLGFEKEKTCHFEKTGLFDGYVISFGQGILHPVPYWGSSRLIRDMLNLPHR